jgi:nicotinamidase/pyrazinamidase
MTESPVQFDPYTALVVVDVQNDFADPDGSLYVAGGEDTIAPINTLIDEAQGADALVAYTQDWHPHETPHFVTGGGPWPVHCVAGTWGAELHPQLHVDGPVVHKGAGSEDGYSGFTAHDVTTDEDVPTGLESLLRNHATERVVVVGLAEDVCVKATALDARRLGFATTVVEAATRPVTPDAAGAARDEMRAAGVVLM